MDLRQLGGTLICQKDSFLCAARGVSLGIYFQQKLSVGFFGGEGFIMQKLDGDGLAFVHAGGTILRRDLQPGETLLIDTGCVVAFTPNANFEIQYVGKIKTALFGGEGLFFAKMTGPGTVWLQSLPFSRLASRVFAAAPQAGGGDGGRLALGGRPVARCSAACSAAAATTTDARRLVTRAACRSAPPQRTTSTGTGAVGQHLLGLAAQQQRAPTPRRPCEAITIRSAPCSLPKSMMASHGWARPRPPRRCIRRRPPAHAALT